MLRNFLPRLSNSSQKITASMYNISAISVGLIKKINYFFPRILSKLVNAPRRCSNFANEIRTSFPWDLWSIEII